MRINVPPKSKLKFTPRLKTWNLKTLISNYFQVFNSYVSASTGVLPLKISGTTSRLACSRQLRRCVAQLGPTNGFMKPGDGMSTWKSPLLPKGTLSRPEKLVKALGHHTMQPNTFQDMQCTMLVKKPTRRPMKILTPSLQKSTALVTSFEEWTLMLWQTNEEWCRGDVIKRRLNTEDLVSALPKASQCWVWLGHRTPVWWTTNGRPAHPNHQWYC